MRSLIPLAVCAVTLGCTSWNDVRRDLVDPINKLVHSDYPKAIRANDVDWFTSLYLADSIEIAKADLATFTWDWAVIEHSSCRICTLGPQDGDSIEAVVELRLDGTGRDGARRTWFEEQVVTCEATPDGWRIARVESGESRLVDDPGARFAATGVDRGLDYVHASFGVVDRRGVMRDYSAGSGLGVGDVDDDGLDDIVLVSGRDVRVFHNRGGTFEDCTEELGFGELEDGEARFAMIADIDGDRDRDVFVGVLNADNVIWLNDGKGGFERTAGADLGITPSHEATSTCLADFDGDGYLDLYVANGANLMSKDPDPIYYAKNGTKNQLFRGGPDGRFTEITDDADCGDTGWALGSCSSDFDQDGDVDLYVANDFGPDCLYRNNGDGTFEEIAHDAGVALRGSSMGSTFGDCDGDGDIDLFVTGMASNAAWLIDQPSYPAPAPWPIRWIFRPFVLDVVREMLHGNRMYLNRGDGTFEEASMPTRTAKAGWAWGGIFFDYDNDTNLDLYLVNGFLSGECKDDL